MFVSSFSSSQYVLVQRVKERGRDKHTEDNSLMWKLETAGKSSPCDYVWNADVWSLFWFVSVSEGESTMIGYDGSAWGFHTHTRGVVISVLADLLMLTCSACLLGSWGSILYLSPSVCLSVSAICLSFITFCFIFCCQFLSHILSLSFCPSVISCLICL